MNAAGLHFLYLHQKQALEAAANGENVVISTGTASGKSLCYQIPIIDMLLADETSTAILVFPTKALTQDQYKSLLKLIPEKREYISIYDGDTPKYQRNAIRTKARVIFTNPDMIHLGILPYHAGWVSFFRNLKYIVYDEAHIYKGVFGAHVANLNRRILRVCEHYLSKPQFILSSATLSNARELSEKLIGQPVVPFNEDHSGAGEKKVFFLNPPVINEEFQLRAGAIFTAAKSVKILMNQARQILVFCQSRQSVESAVRRLRDYDIPADGYRSGYLARERREIEAGLKQGVSRCVAATNALELGMDIGGIDAVISIGYPGAVSALLQRQGRAGRGESDSVFILIGSQNPTDQYLMLHPEFIHARPCEPVLIDPDNLMIVIQHLQCALYELPFDRGDSFGNLTMEETQDLLDYLVSIGCARLSGTRYFWIQSDGPQGTVSLRSSGPDRIAIMCEELGKPKMIGEIDRSSAYWMVHEGAVYFHNGVSYLIRELDLQENTARAARCEVPYTTEALKTESITLNEILTSRELENASLLTADVTVHTQVTGYKKIDNDANRILETLPLDLPEETLDTAAFVIVLSEELQEKLRALALWNSDPNDYGPEWPRLRKQILERDHYTCQLCHVNGDDTVLHVHHIKPFRSFIRKNEANDPENLTTLCPDCHRRVEEAVQMRSGLLGFATAFHQIAALFIECDPNDLCIVTEPNDANFDGKSVFYLHETVPGGIGLSQAIAENYEAIHAAVQDLIMSCDCKDGCPGCVGAAGENGVGGKAEALAICSRIAV